MKLQIIIIFASALLYCRGLEAQAQVAAKSNVLIELQMVAVPEEEGLLLIEEFRDAAKADATYAKIQQMLKKKTAKLLGWPTVLTRIGERATVQSYREFRYATAFDPGAVAILPPKESARSEQRVEQVPGVAILQAPTAFETRHVGITLEVQPTLAADGNSIELSIVPQHVRLKGMNKVVIEREKTKEKAIVEQPEFETIGMTTQLTMKPKQRVLLGVFQPHDLPGQIELMLLSVDVR